MERGLRAKSRTEIVDESFNLGEEIGKAYKSILERLELEEVKSRLDYVGIKTEGKTLGEVLNELSNYYKETKDDETIERLVGLHKKNKLIALLENFESEKGLEKLTKEFKAED
jgi:hypothetical protein